MINKIIFLFFLFFITISLVHATDFELEKKQKTSQEKLNNLNKKIEDSKKVIKESLDQGLLEELKKVEEELYNIIIKQTKPETQTKEEKEKEKEKLKKLDFEEVFYSETFNKGHLILVYSINRKKIQKDGLCLIKDKFPLPSFYTEKNIIEKARMLQCFTSDSLSSNKIESYYENQEEKTKYDQIFKDLENNGFDYSQKEDIKKLFKLFKLTKGINNSSQEENHENLKEYLNIKSYLYEIAYEYKKSKRDKNIERYLNISKEYDIPSKEILRDILNFYQEQEQEQDKNYVNEIDLKVNPKDLIPKIKDYFLKFLKVK